MTFGDYIAIAFVVVFTIVSLAGFWLVAAALWPKRVHRCRQFCEKGILVNFLIGLVPFGIGLIVCLRVIQAGGPVQAAGLVMVGGLLFFCHVGVAGFAEHIGNKLSPPETIQWVRCRRGGGALAATFLIPVIGWVIVFLLVTTLGCGVFLRSLFSKGAPDSETEDLLQRAERLSHTLEIKDEVRSQLHQLVQLFKLAKDEGNEKELIELRRALEVVIAIAQTGAGRGASTDSGAEPQGSTT